MSANALDRALQELAEAQNFLEYAKPGLRDVESSYEHSKRATDILGAACKLMKQSIYTVAEAPPEGKPLFDVNARPEEAMAEEASDRSLFDGLLEDLRQFGVDQGLKEKAWAQCQEAWEGHYAKDPGEALKGLAELVEADRIEWRRP